MGGGGVSCQAGTSFLAVGLSVQLSFPVIDARSQHVATLLGWKEGSWLICEWPFHLGQPVPCEKGTACLLRYMHDGKMIGFRSEVLTTQQEPFPFMLLAYPAAREEVPLRKHCRVSIAEPIVLFRVSDGLPTPRSETPDRIGGLLQDLSTSGCCIALQRPSHDFFPGMMVRLEFEVLGIGHVSNLAGIVRNVSSAGLGAQLGVEFRFDGKEAIEYRGWGGSVQKALDQWTSRTTDAFPPGR